MTTTRRKRTAATTTTTEQAPSSEQRVLDILTTAGGWLNIGEIHDALAGQDAGDIPHDQLADTLAALVTSGRVERAGLTPPRWRIPTSD